MAEIACRRCGSLSGLTLDTDGTTFVCRETEPCDTVVQMATDRDLAYERAEAQRALRRSYRQRPFRGSSGW